ncbi:hypothetical protein MESS2_1670034 [Mesorhizobium metallidurans STM 2683]|uniref:Uncharacterized protein n=1 Tax=Mesorhizobium metallidurans STM 2683 TaxID=1297569 RepID=M5ENR5_9HYPH|nr:hypothetical protein MESS2_1670034 [Mesorhizobium metallidurans STM 2683]
MSDIGHTNRVPNLCFVLSLTPKKQKRRGARRSCAGQLSVSAELPLRDGTSLAAPHRTPTANPHNGDGYWFRSAESLM